MELFTVAIAPGRAADQLNWRLELLADRLRAGLGTDGARGLQRLEPMGRWVAGDLATADGLVALLERVAREQQELAVCVWVGRLRQPELSANASLPRARTAAQRLEVGPQGLTSARREAIAGLLRMHLAIIRHRTPAQWAMLDVVATTTTQAEAAEQLGCSPQAVNQCLKRSHAHAAADTAAALTLLCPATPAELAAAA